MTGKTSLVPNRRFKEFSNSLAWEQRKVQWLIDEGIIEEPMDGNHGEKHPTASEYVDYGIPFLMATDIKNGMVDLKKCNFITIERSKKLDKGFAKNGDVLITHKATIGEVAILSGLSSEYAVLTPQVTYYRVIDKSKISLKYLYVYFNSPDFQNGLKLEATQSTRPYIGITGQHKLDIKFPKAIEEQEKIGEYFSDLDNLITLHQRKLEKTKALKSAYLSEMFPAEGKSVPKRRFAGFTDDWEQHELGDIMEVKSVKRIHQSDWTDKGVRFLRARDIVSASKGEEPADYLYISQEKYDEYSLTSGKVKVGDLLVTGVGSIGIPLLVEHEKPLYFKDGNVIWFKNENQLDGNFFYYSFIGKGIQKYIRDVAGIGTVGTYTIDSGKKTPIQFPSIDEQRKVGAFFRELDNLITLHQRKLEKLQNIKKAYLNEMFV